MDDPTPLWDFEDPAGSLERFEQASAAATGTERAGWDTQRARALGLLGRYAEAHAVLDALPGDDPEVAVRTHLERGRLYRTEGVGDAGAAEFAAAAQLAMPGRDQPPLGGLWVDALHMQALLPSDPEERVRLVQVALTAAETAADPAANRWRASLLTNLGMAQHDAGDDQAALEAFRQAYILREAAGERRLAQIARWQVAWALRLLGRFEEAERDQIELGAELRADGIDDRYVQAELRLLAAGDARDSG